MFQLLFNILGYYPGEKSVMKIFAWITDHLIYFVLGVGIVSFLFPGPGSLFGWIVTPVLALMVLSISMTINVGDLIRVSKYPLVIVWSVILQFVVMALFSILLGRIFLSPMTAMNTGQVLLGSLPADISAPLMISIVEGDTALGIAMLVTAMVLTPFVLPNILTLFGGITLSVPTRYLEVELVGIIIIPLILGIVLNYYSAERPGKTRYMARFGCPLLSSAPVRRCFIQRRDNRLFKRIRFCHYWCGNIA